MSETASSEKGETHRAGLFDIRMIIGLLLAIYGVILVVTSFFTSQEQLDKADGVDVNLWTGLGLVVAAVVFAAWARLRPIKVPQDTDDGDGGDTTKPA